MTLLLSPEEGVADRIDLLRHTLGNLIVPRTVDDITEIFAKYQKTGVVLPSGRTHAEIAIPRDLLVELENAGYAKKFFGFSTHADLNRATEQDASVINHPDPQDTPHAPDRVETYPDGRTEVVKAYVQTHTRGEIWAARAEGAEQNPSAEHWIITHSGFEALTGHPQGVS